MGLFSQLIFMSLAFYLGLVMFTITLIVGYKVFLKESDVEQENEYDNTSIEEKTDDLEKIDIDLD